MKSENPANGRALDTDTVNDTVLHTGTASVGDKWSADWERRVQRALVNADYFDMASRGVQEAAERNRAGWSE